MAFKPVLAHASCLFDIAGFRQIGEKHDINIKANGQTRLVRKIAINIICALDGITFLYQLKQMIGTL